MHLHDIRRPRPLICAEPLEPRRLFDGGDFSLDFAAAAPFTYDHATGGGSFDDRTIGKTNDVVESLEGGDFACGDIVTYFVQISVDDQASGAQTIELDFEFLSDATGQSGVGHDDIVGVKVNYGAIGQVDVDGDGNLDVIGDGPGETDSGIDDDGGSVATLTSETLPSNPFHSGTTNLTGTVEVDDLEAGEVVILRIDVHIDCDDNASPTGNLQAAITDARVTAPDADDISVGNQTVPFKNIDELVVPGVNVVKTGPDLSKIGDEVTYNYVVTNNGNVALDNVVLVDDAGTAGDTGDDFNPTFIGGDDNSNNLLDTDETWTYSETITVPAGASDPFTNTATVTAEADGSGEDTDDQDSHTIELFQPSIDLEKDADRTSAGEGDQIMYSYTVENDGSSDSPALVIDTFVDDNGTPGSTGDDFTPDDVDVDIDNFNDGDANENGMIDVGETWLFTATRTVAAGDDDPLVNTAVIHTHPQNFPNDITDTDTAGVNLFQPAIKVDKTGDAISKVGDKVTYSYSVTNEGSGDSPALENVALLDDAGTPGDTGDDFVPDPVDVNTDTFNDGDTNTDGKLDAGETWLYTAEFTIPAGADDPLVNTVTASADVVGSVVDVTDTDTHSVDLFQPAIQVEKDADKDAAAEGDTVVYSYTVENTGSNDSPGLSIVSLVDDNGTPGDTGDDFTPETVDVDTNNFNDGDANTNGLVDVGETWMFTKTVVIPSGADDPFVNIVEVHANPSGFPNDIADTDSFSLDLFQPDIDIVKTGDELSKVGDYVTYSYAVTNAGSAGGPALENVVVVDDAGTPGDTGDDFNPTFTGGDTSGDGKLDIGETWTYSATFLVPVGADDPLVNTAVATADVVGSDADVSDSDTHSVDLFQPSVSIDKTGPDTAMVGDTVQYTYTLVNTGSSDSPALINIVIVDDNGTPGDTGDDFSPTFTGGDTIANGKLDLGETWTYVASRLILDTDSNPLVNTAVVTSNPDGFPNVITDSDTHSIEIVEPPHESGRMTGGGSVFLANGMIGGPAGTRVTHGFQIHCSPDPTTGRFEDVNNRLEINWRPAKANVHFHLSYLVDVQCEDDPFLDPEHPLAPIDTFRGVGVGTFTGKINGVRYNKATATIIFVFTDDGERGTRDTASYLIKIGNVVILQTEADPTLDTDDPGDLLLTFGNHQAHKEIPPLLGNDSTLNSTRRKIDSTLNSLNKESLTDSKVKSLTSQLVSLTEKYNARATQLLPPPPVFSSTPITAVAGSVLQELEAMMV